MRGSWAGAMGQLQFMPSTFIDYAKDGDGDGRKNIWGSAADALESAANFMSSGWEGRTAMGPAGTGAGPFQSVARWSRRGAGRSRSGRHSAFDCQVAKRYPARTCGRRWFSRTIGSREPAFLVYQNYPRPAAVEPLPFLRARCRPSLRPRRWGPAAGRHLRREETSLVEQAGLKRASEALLRRVKRVRHDR